LPFVIGSCALLSGDNWRVVVFLCITKYLMILILKIAWGIVLWFLAVFYLLPIVMSYVFSLLNLLTLFVIIPIISLFRDFFMELGKIWYHWKRIKRDLKKDSATFFSPRIFSFKEQISWSFCALGFFSITLLDVFSPFWLNEQISKILSVPILLIVATFCIYFRFRFMINRINPFDISFKMKLIVIIGIPVLWVILSVWVEHFFQYQLVPFYHILYWSLIIQSSDQELLCIIPKKSQKLQDRFNK